MKPLKILLASSEVVPFAKTGGLADVIGSLPDEFEFLGHETRVFLPYYRHTKNQKLGIKIFKENLKAKLGDWDINFSLYHCRRGKIDFYLIDKPEYFDRNFLYGTSLGDYPDNAVRFAFFAKAILSSAAAIKFKPDIIHCNDWQTALVPFYLKIRLAGSKFFVDTKTLFTIHNLAYQGLFDKKVMSKIGIDQEFFTADSLEFHGKLSFIKSGILYSDGVSTVSRGYAREILTKEFGCGLESLLRRRRGDLYGIVNGVDYSQWDPETDEFIKAKYDKTSLENKTECKKDLLAEMKLPLGASTPLLGVISRLAEQKGIDIIADSAPGIIKLGCKLVILGVGDEKHHKLLRALAKRYPKDIAVKIAFDNVLAHKIEAGCDMFLMPSRYEPCGLNQMYSLKYGTITVARAVGGLNDTIIDYSRNPKSGNGFKFAQADTADFTAALGRAVSVYKNKKEWNELMVKAMGFNFSWRQSAKEYIKVYKAIINPKL